MTVQTPALHPGALYVHSPRNFQSVILAEVVSVTAYGSAFCLKTISSDPADVPPVKSVIASHALDGEHAYVYAGDVRDHDRDPDVGDIYVWERENDNYGGTYALPDGPTMEVIGRTRIDRSVDRVTVVFTSRETGNRWNQTVRVSEVTTYCRWVGYTRPTFDTPERYAS